MKINEKHLNHLASSSSAVDKEGWLLKRGEVNKSFQRRWFVLRGNLLFYFDKKGDREPVGVVVLEGCTIELAENEDQYTFKVVFHGAGGRTYILGADSQESMESWMKALACASYDYMKLMVAELQRQMDELVAIQKVVESSKPDPKIPVAPPRQHQRQRRVNPFNNCQKEDEEEKSKGHTRRQWESQSVPNTPLPVRPAPPIPSQAASSSGIHLTSLQEGLDSLGLGTGSQKKSFASLHEEYGHKIRQCQSVKEKPKSSELLIDLN